MLWFIYRPAYDSHRKSILTRKMQIKNTIYSEVASHTIFFFFLNFNLYYKIYFLKRTIITTFFKFVTLQQNWAFNPSLNKQN